MRCGLQAVVLVWAAADAGGVAALGKSLLQRRSLRERTGAVDGSPADELHTVYPASCSAFSLHQAIALDWSWRNVGQPGRLTRIVTGCKLESDKKKAMQSVLSGDPRFDVFFTEDWNTEVPRMFPEVRSDNYMAYNRPFGLAAWFERARPQEAHIMYLDPDMIFVQPLLYHLSSSPVHVTEGHPVAQHYSYITANAGLTDPGWHDFAIPELCGPECPRLADAQRPHERSFAVGSPIVMHGSDWAKLLPAWTNYTVFIRSHGHVHESTWIKKGDPPYIAEMIAYSLAAVTSNLPHQVVDFTADGMRKDYNPPSDGARLIHLCYPLRSRTANFRWNKYRAPFAYGAHGFSAGGPHLIDCGMPLFAELPPRSDDTGTRRDSYWMIQETTRAYNRAFLEFKQGACPREQVDSRGLVRMDEDGWYVLNDSWTGGLLHAPRVPGTRVLSKAVALQRGWAQPWWDP